MKRIVDIPPALVLFSALAVFTSPIVNASIMEEIIVTATRTDKVLLNNPYSVGLINRDQIESHSADQVAEYINDVPGVYISDAGQAGFKRIRIRGEEARRMAFLIDGQEFMDHREVGVPLLADPASIQRIEVVRGPASVLYGPKAMGGVINVITDADIKEPLSASASMLFDSSTHGSSYAAGLSGASGSFQWRLAAIDNKQEDRDTPEGKIENTSYESDGMSLLVKRITDKTRLTFGYEDFNSNSEIYVAPEVRFSFPFVDFRIDAPQRDREKFRIAYQSQGISDLIDKIQVNAYRQTSDRKFNTFPSLQFAPFLPRTDTSIFSTSQLISEGVNTQITWLPTSSHTLVTGLQYLKDKVGQDRHREVLTDGTLTATEDVFDKAHNQTTAIYIQDDWQISKPLSFLVGVRYYQVDGELNNSSRFVELPDFDDDHTIASMAFVYSQTESLTYRFNYSEGYIFPSLLNLVIGAYAGPRYVNPDAALRPETSDTFEFGIRYSSNNWTLDSTLFRSRAEDYIDHVFCQPSDNCLTAADKIYKNTGEANSHGAEINLSYSTDNIDLYNNFTWLRRKKEYEGVDSYKSGVPALSGRLGIMYSSKLADKPISIDIYSRYESDADEIQATSSATTIYRYEKWITLNLDVNLRIGENYIFNTSLNNITDRKYSGATENLYAPKRHITFKFAARF